MVVFTRYFKAISSVWTSWVFKKPERKGMTGWIIRTALSAYLLSQLIVVPMLFWINPEQILFVSGLFFIAAITVTPIIGYQIAEYILGLLERQQHLLYLANHDRMTGLLNRSYFAHCLEKLTDKCQASERDMAVIAVDIDKFKSINDHYGHAVGDEVIIGLADLMKDLAPDDALIGRTGGEEFFVVFAGDEDQAETFASSLCRSFEYMTFSGISATVSAGYVIGRTADYCDLCVRADNALYVAKNAGRNCYKKAA